MLLLHWTLPFLILNQSHCRGLVRHWGNFIQSSLLSIFLSWSFVNCNYLSAREMIICRLCYLAIVFEIVISSAISSQRSLSRFLCTITQARRLSESIFLLFLQCFSYAGMWGVIVGFGRTQQTLADEESSGLGSNTMLQSSVQVITNTKCSAMYIDTKISATMLCAYAPGTDTCQVWLDTSFYSNTNGG